MPRGLAATYLAKQAFGRIVSVVGNTLRKALRSICRFASLIRMADNLINLSDYRPVIERREPRSVPAERRSAWRAWSDFWRSDVGEGIFFFGSLLVTSVGFTALVLSCWSPT